MLMRNIDFVSKIILKNSKDRFEKLGIYYKEVRGRMYGADVVFSIEDKELVFEYDGLEERMNVIVQFPDISIEERRHFYIGAFFRRTIASWSKESVSPGTPDQLAKSVELWVDAIIAHFEVIKALKPDSFIPL